MIKDPLTEIRERHDYPETPTEKRNFEVRHLSLSSRFKTMVIEESKGDIARVRNRIGFAQLTSEDVAEHAETAVKLGYFRALYMSLVETKEEVDKGWWYEKREESGIGKRQRQLDSVIVAREFGEELVGYFPSPPLSLEVILRACRLELRDIIAAPGTTFREEELKARAFKGKMLEVGGDPQAPPTEKFKDVDSLDDDPETLEGEKEFVDTRAYEIVDDFEVEKLSQVEDHLYGPVVTRLATKAVELFGPVHGLYWLYGHLHFNNKITELVRSLSGTEEELGKKKFEAIKRDFTRKFPKMDAVIAEAVKDDKELYPVFEELFGEEWKP